MRQSSRRFPTCRVADFRIGDAGKGGGSAGWNPAKQQLGTLRYGQAGEGRELRCSRRVHSGCRRLARGGGGTVYLPGLPPGGRPLCPA